MSDYSELRQKAVEAVDRYEGTTIGPSQNRRVVEAIAPIYEPVIAEKEAHLDWWFETATEFEEKHGKAQQQLEAIQKSLAWALNQYDYHIRSSGYCRYCAQRVFLGAGHAEDCSYGIALDHLKAMRGKP